MSSKVSLVEVNLSALHQYNLLTSLKLLACEEARLASLGLFGGEAASQLKKNRARKSDFSRPILLAGSACNSFCLPFRYSVMAGTPIKMVEYLLETRIDKTCSFDGKRL